MHERIRQTSPDIPDEVLQMWLLPYANDLGWPPCEGRWNLILGGKSINFWNEAEWEKTEFDTTTQLYSPEYYDKMRGMHEAYNLGIQNEYATGIGEGGKRRYLSSLDYIIRNRIFPTPPIVFARENGLYDVLDGNHRFLGLVAAWRTYEEFERSTSEKQSEFLTRLNLDNFSSPSSIQEVWMCHPNWNRSSS